MAMDELDNLRQQQTDLLAGRKSSQIIEKDEKLKFYELERKIVLLEVQQSGALDNIHLVTLMSSDENLHRLNEKKIFNLKFVLKFLLQEVYHPRIFRHQPKNRRIVKQLKSICDLVWKVAFCIGLSIIFSPVVGFIFFFGEIFCRAFAVAYWQPVSAIYKYDPALQNLHPFKRLKQAVERCISI